MKPREIRELADYAEDSGAHVKARYLRSFADEIELYEPVVEAVRREKKMGEYDRERVESYIREQDSQKD